MTTLPKKILIIVITFFTIISLGIFAYIILNQSKEKSKEVWNSEKIEDFSESLLSSLNSDPDSTEEFKNFCFIKKNTDCIANVISKNYPYLSSYAKNPNTVLEDEKMRKLYSAACLKDCYGVKGKWTTQFFNAMVAIIKETGITNNSECCVKYMETNADPLDLMDTTIFTKVRNDALNSCNKSNSCISSSCYGLQCGDKNECQETCEDCTICKCPYNKVCNNDTGECIVQNVDPDSSCIPNCWHKNCGESDGCKGICSDCTICACPKGKDCYGNQCLEKTQDCDCSAKKCGEDNGCGGICWNCPDKQLCDGKKCVPIDPSRTQNEWTNEKIQELSVNLFNHINNDPNFLPPVKTLINSEVGDCMANIISNEYTYDDIKNKHIVVPNYNEILKMCTANALGVKGLWSDNFYNAMKLYVPSLYIYGSQIPLVCMLNYIRSNYEPIDLNLSNIQAVVQKAQSICYQVR
jgi:hypothetical protein